MKKPLLTLLMLVGALLSPLAASAYDFEAKNDDGVAIFYVINSDGSSVSVSKDDINYSQYSGKVNIPSSVSYEGNTYSVTAIGNDAFYQCYDLTEVTIPASVTAIGNEAFCWCTNLPEITIPASVTTIGFGAFEGCTNLAAIYGEFASDDHRCLIRDGHLLVFAPAGLSSYYIPDTVTAIGNSAFSGYFELTEVTIPNSVTTIGDRAFLGCFGLTKMTIPNSVTAIGKHAFYFCLGLTEMTIPNSVTAICDGTFAICEGLTSLSIPNSVTTIGEEAFYGCTGLTEVTIPNSVTSIGKSAFSDCSGLTEVTIPDSVTSIGTYAFRDCNGITTVNFNATNCSMMGTDHYCPVFQGCNNLTTLNIGENVTIIPPFAFSHCSALTEVTIPNSVTSIGSYAFYVCSGLTELTIGSSVTYIYREAFHSCSALTDIVVPRRVEIIGPKAFYNCTAVRNIAIGYGVKKIGELAFDDVNADSDVCVAATIPPLIDDNTFSTYSLPLYVPEESINAYHESPLCWSRFDPKPLKVITTVTIDGSGATANKEIGDTFKLTATFEPADASMPYIFWCSTNPEVATVDNFGNVTIISEGVCEIIAETLYADGPEASYKLNVGNNGIEDIVADNDRYAYPRDIYTLQGICIKRNASDLDVKALTPGLYIIAGRKVLIK